MKKIRKRQLKNKITKNKSKIVVIVCVIFVLFLSVGYGVSTTLITLNGSATIGEESNCKDKVSGTYNLNTFWNGENNNKHYSSILKIKNEGTESIPSWIIKIKGPRDIQIQVNANVTKTDDGILTLTPYSWNSVIDVGKELSLDFISITVEDNFEPVYITFNDCKIYGNGIVTPDPEPIDPTIKLTNLELSPSKYEMIVSEKITLNTIKTPNNATAILNYISSDTNVATVSQTGEVTAISKGTVIITVTSGTISATSTIIVKEKEETPITPDGIDLKFVQTGYWGDISTGQSMDFNITITNNSENNINSCSFLLGLPSGTKYSIWTGNVSVNDGSFIYNAQLNTNSNIIIYGQVTLPSGYDINNYLSPSITKVQVS